MITDDGCKFGEQDPEFLLKPERQMISGCGA